MNSKESPLTLEVRKLDKSFRGRRVVNDVSLTISSGEVVGLLGPNGAGKTTTFYMIVGLTTPDSGSVHLSGEEITSLPMLLTGQTGNQLPTSGAFRISETFRGG